MKNLQAKVAIGRSHHSKDNTPRKYLSGDCKPENVAWADLPLATGSQWLMMILIQYNNLAVYFMYVKTDL